MVTAVCADIQDCRYKLLMTANDCLLAKCLTGTLVSAAGSS